MSSRQCQNAHRIVEGRVSDPVALGIDPGQFLADTIREEPASRARADRLVATALAIKDS